MGRTDRLAGKAVSLLQFEAAALFLLLRSGTLLQTISRDLEAHLQVGQRGKGVLQRRQEVLRGVRTMREIDEERFALKALRGDFGPLGPGPHNRDDRASHALQAARL